MSLTRRELKSRSTTWAKGLARALARAGVHPNLVSVLSIGFALVAGGCLWAFADVPTAARPWVALAALAGIQLRLLCNLMDGMLAIEHAMKSPLGDLYNEVPDRIADSVIFIGLGYAASGPFHADLGWLAALLAMFTAYLRVLGGSLRLEQRFLGPMAKQHRMAAVSAGLVLAVGLRSILDERAILHATLVLIAAGTAITCVRRLLFVASELRKAGGR